MGSAISLKNRQETVHEMLVRCLSTPASPVRTQVPATAAGTGQRVCGGGGGGAPVDLVVEYAYADPRLDVLRASDDEFRAWLEALQCNADSVRIDTRDCAHAYPVLAFPGARWRIRPHSLCAHVTVSRLAIDRRRYPEVARRLSAIHGAMLAIRPRRPTASLGQTDDVCESWSLVSAARASERGVLVTDDDRLDDVAAVVAGGDDDGGDNRADAAADTLLFGVRHYDTRLVTRVAHDRYDPTAKRYVECDDDDANRDANDRAAILVLCHASRIAMRGGDVL